MACFGLALSISAQEEPVDSLEGTKVVLDEVLVQSIRITKDFPITFSDLDKVELAPRNLGQDIPILMNCRAESVTSAKSRPLACI